MRGVVLKIRIRVVVPLETNHENPIVAVFDDFFVAWLLG